MMKGTLAVLLALLLVTFGITDAEAGNTKKRAAVPTVLAPALPASTPTVAPPPRVESTPPTPVVAETAPPPTTQSARKCEVRQYNQVRPGSFVSVESLAFATCDGRFHTIPGFTVQTPASQLSSTGIYCR